MKRLGNLINFPSIITSLVTSIYFSVYIPVLSGLNRYDYYCILACEKVLSGKTNQERTSKGPFLRKRVRKSQNSEQHNEEFVDT